ncbi:LIS1 (LisH) motif [Carpediemonas membranifera]|uniref:LIS1 (LisH) motif n=1 Tax=Carpediemonas membranifera TaxID=201153 RepID=A0A8J6B8P5_9EUKA|nr:LIS1 (LisH) motif [Carpediemonas membranifera]|eukprot:KAG9395489.1 LIS1 (LisH) motif [Carpediemonas membranifera]
MQSSVASSAVLDDLVEEYLLFRGLNDTLAAFRREIKQDRLQAFDKEKLTRRLITLCKEGRNDELWDTWNYIVDRFCKEMNPDLQRALDTARQLLQQLMIVHAVERHDKTKVHTLLAEMAAVNSEPSHWYGIEHLPNPAHTAFFAPFFTNDWKESVATQLCNTISLVFQAVPQPRLLGFRTAQLNMKKMEARVHHLSALLDMTGQMR